MTNTARKSELRTAIGEEVARVCASPLVRSIVLTGSVARDEATAVRAGDGIRVLGDAELFLVLRDGIRLPDGNALRQLATRVEGSLARRGIECRVELCGARASYFESLPPAIFSYELRTEGKVLLGEDVLALVPPFPRDQIPPDDAFRLLCNRMIELLGALSDSGGSGTEYATAKLYLDMSTSLLVFARRYEPSYAARQARLDELASQAGGRAEWPLELARFAAAAGNCTGWKLRGGAPENSIPCWRDALRDARRLWRWELERLTGACKGGADREFLERWAQMQPWAGRARGWAYAIRAAGLRGGWKLCARWAGGGRGASPRAWIYGAAAELAFAMAAGAAPPAALETRLPDRGKGAPGDDRELCRRVYFNYRRFLAGTRA